MEWAQNIEYQENKYHGFKIIRWIKKFSKDESLIANKHF